MTPQPETDLNSTLERLQQFDRAVWLVHPDCRFDVVIAGGGAMVLLGVLARPTDDIDALQFPHELLTLMQKFDLNGKVAAYQHNFPYHFEDRLVEIEFPFRVLRCFAVSLEDLVISKLYSSRTVDASDIRQPQVLAALDWDQLAKSFEDARLSSMNDDRYHELGLAYASYREEFGPCDD